MRCSYIKQNSKIKKIKGEKGFKISRLKIERIIVMGIENEERS